MSFSSCILTVYGELCAKGNMCFGRNTKTHFFKSKHVLSVSDILEIDNLWSFECLTKLQLDNNIIEKIKGLDELVNLIWLGKLLISMI